MVDFLACHLSRPATASKAESVRARLHPKRSANSAGEGCLVTADSSPADLGIRGRQVHDGSDLVVLSFLATEIPEHKVWTVIKRTRPSLGCHLCHLRSRQY